MGIYLPARTQSIIARYEQAARQGEDAIRRLREIAPPYQRLGKVDDLIDELAREVERTDR